jgi:catechol 2,3-dioxygenase-like lactoylglutathione lyase family enzyme
MSMRLEHVALNVADPAGMAAWWVEHLGLRVARRMESAPYTHFLAEPESGVCLEVYCNPANAVPDYVAQSILQVHVAFVSGDPQSDRVRLEAAGATYVEAGGAGGDLIVTMRDPWGVPFQLCRRGRALTGE